MLAARSAGTLQEVVAECAARGAHAVTAVPTDISDESQVETLMNVAVDMFGRIDVCVGSASVYSYGTFEQTPSEVFRQIVETNLFGSVYTARAALSRFRVQGYGKLIIIGSVYSKITSPYVSPYVTSKFGLLGFLEVLRQELRQANDIHICTVLPATIDTPIYQHAANYTGRQVHPLPPVVSPHRVAGAILRTARRPRPVRVVGRIQGALIPVHNLLPALYDQGINPIMNLLALRNSPAIPRSGTVFAPDSSSNQITGHWRSARIRIFAVVTAILTIRSLIHRSRRETLKAPVSSSGPGPVDPL